MIRQTLPDNLDGYNDVPFIITYITNIHTDIVELCPINSNYTSNPKESNSTLDFHQPKIGIPQEELISEIDKKYVNLTQNKENLELGSGEINNPIKNTDLQDKYLGQLSKNGLIGQQLSSFCNNDSVYDYGQDILNPMKSETVNYPDFYIIKASDLLYGQDYNLNDFKPHDHRLP